jgi:dTDP-4-amino-4,6-dideoxygalactose transaminase
MILMNDFKAEPPELRQQMLAAASRVLDSGWYILGSEGAAFEAEWAKACGVRHGVGVANGMDAIEIGLRALGIGAGDEVVTTPMTAFATVLAIHRAGATPVLADIDPETALLSRESAARCIGPRTRAVVLVHLYGQVRDMPEWQQFCRERRIALIEDCAQAHLAAQGGRVAGSFGAFAAYSFYPTKNLGALGDAGMLVTDDTDLAARAGVLRNYGQSERYHHPQLGMNSRLDEIQAALLRVRLPWLARFTLRRSAIAAAYRAGMTNPAVRQLAAPVEPDTHVHHLFVVACERRDALSGHLREHGVQALIHYPIPVHLQPPCARMRRDPLGLAHSERHAGVCLSLPCHPQMTDADVEAVIVAVNSFDNPPAG